VNILAAYLFLVAVNFIDWDMLICSYNLNHSKQAQLDVNFIMNLSDKTLPMIINKKATIQNTESRIYYIDNYVDFETALRYRLNEFRFKKSKQTWLSWTWLEASAFAKVGAK
jgi:hypothetical protein